MEDLKEINAAWAHKTANTILGEKAQKQLAQILGQIKAAALKNNFSLTASELEDISKKELENRGFNIKYYEGDQRGPRERGYFTISW